MNVQKPGRAEYGTRTLQRVSPFVRYMDCALNSPGKNKRHHEQEQRKSCPDLGSRRPCDAHVCKGSFIDHESPYQQEHQTPTLVLGVGDVSILVHADEEVKGEVDGERCKRVPHHLDDNVCKDKVVPSVSLRRSLSTLVE